MTDHEQWCLKNAPPQNIAFMMKSFMESMEYQFTSIRQSVTVNYNLLLTFFHFFNKIHFLFVKLLTLLLKTAKYLPKGEEVGRG